MYIIILKNTEKNLDFFDKIKVSIFKIHFYSQKSGFKAELIYPNKFNTEDQLDEAVNRYVHVWYNHIRPHSYNGGLTPFEARNLAVKRQILANSNVKLFL